jgi:hypothetical protein
MKRSATSDTQMRLDVMRRLGRKNTRRRSCCNLRSKGIGVALKDLSHSLLSDGLILDIIAAPIAITVLTVLST